MTRKTVPLLAGMLAALLASALDVPAAVRLPSIISDHMVLQSGTAANIWGWATPGEAVTVAIADQKKDTTADAKGNWQLKLAPLAAGGPYTLKISGSNALIVNDVLAGEVWLGSGQSNMAFPFTRYSDYKQREAAFNLPQIRMFVSRAKNVATTPQDDLRGSWLITAPDNMDDFSVPLFFFGRELNQTLHVPVGLIKAAVGGTPIELWIDESKQKAEPQLTKYFALLAADHASFDPAKVQARVDAIEAAPPKPGKRERQRQPIAHEKRNATVGGLFNSQIHPLLPYTIRGVLWYQGEANSRRADHAIFYQYFLPLLVTDWRERWGYEFPMAWAQLPNYQAGKDNGWPATREAELKTLKLPNTGMAINIDIGEQHNIHPHNKLEVGHRFAQWALGTVYGQSNETSGPLYSGYKINGSAVALSFTHTTGGLVAKGGPLREFVIAGADKQWKPATAHIEGDQIIVSSPAVKAPVAVRYGWRSFPDCNLYNGAGLPASPFRTDVDGDPAPLEQKAADSHVEEAD